VPGRPASPFSFQAWLSISRAARVVVAEPAGSGASATANRPRAARHAWQLLSHASEAAGQRVPRSARDPEPGRRLLRLRRRWTTCAPRARRDDPGNSPMLASQDLAPPGVGRPGPRALAQPVGIIVRWRGQFVCAAVLGSP
jgi:hypothetical protein